MPRQLAWCFCDLNSFPLASNFGTPSSSFFSDKNGRYFEKFQKNSKQFFFLKLRHKENLLS